MFIGRKKSILQLSADNTHIYESTDKVNIQHFLKPNLGSKSEYVYLMECIFCKMQYIGKAETAFNLRLNNNKKDTIKT